jgi:hypothetical protein
VADVQLDVDEQYHPASDDHLVGALSHSALHSVAHFEKNAQFVDDAACLAMHGCLG